jgi:hypothetical protein
MSPAAGPGTFGRVQAGAGAYEVRAGAWETVHARLRLCTAEGSGDKLLAKAIAKDAPPATEPNWPPPSGSDD